jgi:recombination protein RecA
MFDEGISSTGDLLDMAVEAKVVDKSGAWFTFGPTRLGQGRENAKKFVKDNAELAKEIRSATMKIRLAALASSPAPTPPADVDTDTGEVLED